MKVKIFILIFSLTIAKSYSLKCLACDIEDPATKCDYSIKCNNDEEHCETIISKVNGFYTITASCATKEKCGYDPIHSEGLNRCNHTLDDTECYTCCEEKNCNTLSLALKSLPKNAFANKTYTARVVKKIKEIEEIAATKKGGLLKKIQPAVEEDDILTTKKVTAALKTTKKPIDVDLEYDYPADLTTVEKPLKRLNSDDDDDSLVSTLTDSDLDDIEKIKEEPDVIEVKAKKTTKFVTGAVPKVALTTKNTNAILPANNTGVTKLFGVDNKFADKNIANANVTPLISLNVTTSVTNRPATETDKGLFKKINFNNDDDLSLGEMNPPPLDFNVENNNTIDATGEAGILPETHEFKDVQNSAGFTSVCAKLFIVACVTLIIFY
jgi:hypothetical protein